MRKIRHQKAKPKKEKIRKEDEINFWDVLLEASCLGLFPKMP